MAYNLDEVVASIDALHTTKDNAHIATIQDQLQRLQKLEHGYTLGRQLLHRPQAPVQYFGALTITVFVTTHPDQVIPHAQQLLPDLVAMMYQVYSQGRQHAYVLRKLILGFALIYRLIAAVESLDTRLDPTALLVQLPQFTMAETGALTEPQWEILLQFYTIMPEDYRRETLKQLHENVKRDVWPLVAQVLVHNPPNQVLAMGAAAAWVPYIATADGFLSPRYSVDDARPLIRYMLAGLTPSDLEGATVALLGLTEVYEMCPLLLDTDTKNQVTEILFTPGHFGPRVIDNVIGGGELADDLTFVDAFVTFLGAYLGHHILYLLRHLHEELVQQILRIVLRFCHFDGQLPLEELVSEPLLMFWEEFVLTLEHDATFIKQTFQNDPEGYQAHTEARDQILQQCTQVYWQKAQIHDELPSELVQYRTLVGDLFVLVLELILIPFYITIADSVKLALQASNATDLEVLLYMWYKVTEELAFYDECSDHTLIVVDVFRQGLIEGALALMGQQTYVSRQLEITTLRLLGSLKFVFNTDAGAEYLLAVLEFLFGVILTGLVPSLIALKTVLEICQESPARMVPFLPNLEPVVEQMIGDGRVDNVIRERMCNAVVSIAQGVKDPAQFASVIKAVVSKIVAVAASLINDPDALAAVEDYAVSLVLCINEVAKALRLPEDHDDWLTPDQQRQTNEYWSQDPLEIKPLILNCVSQFGLQVDLLARNPIVVEKCCHIFKNGLGEAVDGPFCFPLATILDFISTKIPATDPAHCTPLYLLLETIAITLAPKLGANEVAEIVRIAFVDRQAQLTHDLDLVKPVLLVFTTLIDKTPSHLIKLLAFQNQGLLFALEAFSSKDIFTIKAVNQFWLKFLQLKRGSHEDHQLLQNLVVGDGGHQLLGFRLTEALTVLFVTGLRLSLEHYYPVFRTLVAKLPMHFKQWLLVVVESLPLTKCGQEVRQQFVSQLMVTRGQRQAHDVLKRFWLAANGLSEYK